MAADVPPTEPAWLRIRDLHARINAELLKMMSPRARQGKPWVVDDKSLQELLEIVPADSRFIARGPFSKHYSVELVDHLSLIAGARLNGLPLSETECAALFSDDVPTDPAPPQ